MDSQQEEVVTCWTEAGSAAFVEDVGCGMQLEWRAVDSTESSDALGRQSETEPVAAVDFEAEGRNHEDNCQNQDVESQDSSYRTTAMTGTWLLRCKNRSKVLQMRYIQSYVQRIVIRLKGPRQSVHNPLDGRRGQLIRCTIELHQTTKRKETTPKVMDLPGSFMMYMLQNVCQTLKQR